MALRIVGLASRARTGLSRAAGVLGVFQAEEIAINSDEPIHRVGDARAIGGDRNQPLGLRDYQYPGSRYERPGQDGGLVYMPEERHECDLEKRVIRQDQKWREVTRDIR